MPFGTSPDVLLGRLLVIFLGIPLHEWAHGWMAHMLGDETPELQGRLTLNPFVHLDPIGTIAILLTGFGWGRSARVNPFRMTKARNPRVGMALSALAGPLSNIVQAMVLAMPFRLGMIDLWGSDQELRLALVLLAAIQVNVGLAVFNMLPIPPLDGSKVLAGVAPSGVGDFIENLEPYAGYILIFVVFLLPQMGFNLIRFLATPAQQFLLRVLLPW